MTSARECCREGIKSLDPDESSSSHPNIGEVGVVIVVQPTLAKVIVDLIEARSERELPANICI